MLVSFLNVKVPEDNPIISTKLNLCPHCSEPLSYSNGYEWCRECHKKTRKAVEKYLKVVKEGK